MILQFPIPGAVELIVLFLIVGLLLAFVAVPVLLVVLLYRWASDDGGEADEVAELRERVAKLETRIEERNDGDADR